MNLTDLIRWQPGGVRVIIALDDERHAWLRAIEPANSTTSAEVPGHADRILPLAEVRLGGEGLQSDSSKRQVGTYVGHRLRYVRHEERRENGVEVLDVVSQDPVTGVTVTNFFSAFADLPVLRCKVEIRNDSQKPVVLHMLSSLVVGGLTSQPEKWWEEFDLVLPTSAWFREAMWEKFSLPQVGLDDFALSKKSSSRSSFALSSHGSFSTLGHLPMGALSRADGRMTWLWQIEHNGSWQWEIGDYRQSLYLQAMGPSHLNHSSSRLDPGASFTSVPASLTVVPADLQAAFTPLTQYRRRIRRFHKDNEQLPVIFNDYMNCLMGDPTAAKVEALIKPAVDAGAEYFCIDCGWYSDDSGWWDSVGEWEPSKTRFAPGGLKQTLKKIRDEGLIPGLWVEPEVMGVRSPALEKLPREAFFQRDGELVKECGRYQLDYRHPDVIKRMDAIIDRLVNDYGVGYFKFDYNIDVGIGTDVNSHTPGSGMLEHNRAYLAWVNRLFDRFPSLVIESCSSGGQRLDYAMLSTHPLQSTSDQEDPIYYAPIAASMPTAVAPEQSASWAYPQPDWDDERNVYTIVNSLLGRVHISGKLQELSKHQSELVAKGIAVYKEIRQDLRHGVPFWPLGLPGWHDDWIALGIDCGQHRYLSVWRRGVEQSCNLPIPELKDIAARPDCLFPSDMPADASWDREGGVLRVELPNSPSARLFRLTTTSKD